jgi:cell division protein FtsW
MIKNKNFDKTLLTVVIILLGMGLVSVYSAGSEIAVTVYKKSRHYFLLKQMIFLFIGLVIMSLTIRTPLGFFQSLGKPAFFFAIFSLILVLFVGREVNGATRWFHTGLINIHPAAISQVVTIIFIADFLSRRNEYLSDIKRLIPVLTLVSLTSLLIMLQPDFSTAIMLMIIVFAMLFLSAIPLRNVFIIFFTTIGFSGPILLLKPYRINRIKDWLAGLGENTLHGNYQSDQSLLSFGIGGFSGVGFGQSKQKFLFLPEAQTDYIFSIVGEEMGFIGTSLILFLFMIIIWRGFKITRHSTTLFEYFLAGGLTIYIGLYALVNIAVVTSILPTTGLPLPFLSYGGSSLVLNLFAIGLLLRISRNIYSVQSESFESSNEVMLRE